MITSILFMTIHVAIAVYFLGRYAQTKKKNIISWIIFNIIFAGVHFISSKYKYEEKFSIKFNEHIQQYHQPIEEPTNTIQ